MKVSVILATYNEAENVRRIIPKLAEVLSKYDREIVLVDDSSPDGTAEVARRVSIPRRDRVKIIVRQERGLTSAQLRGIRESSGEIVVIMDADGQHDPEFVPQLVDKVLEGYDLAIASRYVKGGSPGGFSGLKRYFYSYIACLLPRIIFFPRVRKIKDPMSGFFAARREVICEKIDPRFPKILLEILVMCNPKRIIELPYKFKKRLYGRSKLTFKHVVEYLEQLASLVRRTFFRCR